MTPQTTELETNQEELKARFSETALEYLVFGGGWTQVCQHNERYGEGTRNLMRANERNLELNRYGWQSSAG